MRYNIIIIGGAIIHDVTNGVDIIAPIPFIEVYDVIQVNGSYEWYDAASEITYRVDSDDVQVQ